MMRRRPESPILLFDGVCKFCSAAVQFILPRDREASLRFAPLQSEYGMAVLRRHPELSDIDSLIVIDHDAQGREIALVRSAAVLRLVRYLGAAWKLLLVLSIIPRPLRDFFYDWFAARRYRLFGRSEQCWIPDPADRSRFLS